MMIDYSCKICGETHKLVTLLEFSQPDIISEISSGKSSESLETAGKDMFLVSGKTIHLQCQIIIELVDFEDELEMLVWAEVSGKEALAKKDIFKKGNKVILNGMLNWTIPFYDNTINLPVEILINSEDSGIKPQIMKIQRDIELKNDLKNGNYSGGF
ncbi:MAG: hypothetical protein ACI9LN_003606 [Saprospiraceae bacterium]|jgi:hypothetical protein